MNSLIVGAEEISSLKALAKYAEDHPISMDDKLDQMNGAINMPGLDPNYQRLIPMGFKVVFTIEPNDKGDLIRRLSMSAPAAGHVPNPAAVQMIMKILGFENELSDCKISMEKIDGDEHAVNVGELLTLRN